MNYMFHNENPLAKIMPVERAKGLFKRFVFSILEAGKRDYENLDYDSKDLIRLAIYELSPYHSVECKSCHMLIDEQYVITFSYVIPFSSNQKICIFCTSADVIGKYEKCGKYFYDDRHSLYKAYPVLHVNQYNPHKKIKDIPMEQLKSLGTAIEDEDGQTLKVYLRQESFSSAIMKKLFPDNTRKLNVWKKTFGCNICPRCLEIWYKLYSVDEENENSFTLKPLNENDIQNNLPYSAEKVDLGSQKIIANRKAAIEMVERELSNDISPLFYLLKDQPSKKIYLKKISETIVSIIIPLIAKKHIL